MYFFYIDESGNRDPQVFGKKQSGVGITKDHIYCLTAVGLFEGRWVRFDRELSDIKRELSDDIYRIHKIRFDLADCEIKSNWIRNLKERQQKSPFLAKTSEIQIQRLMRAFYDQLQKHNMVLFSVVIDKRKLHGHMTHELVHKKAYELLLERIEHFMREYHPKHNGLIVMDNTDKYLNRAVTMKHAFFQREGNRHMYFGHIIEYPFFTDSKLSNGIQLADLCSYNIYRAFRWEEYAYPYFQMLLPNFYRRPESHRVEGIKVFPEDSSLIEFSRKGWESFKLGKS